MTLEAVAFPQHSYNAKDLYKLLQLGPPNWVTTDFNFEKLAQLVDQDQETSFLENQPESSNLCGKEWNAPPPPALCEPVLRSSFSGDRLPVTAVPVRAKRRRSKSRKNKEEIENQRMTHIAVERNRRKQMNEYLAVLRSLMPESYVQRGDQASIVGGAINFVKELEQRLHLLGGREESNGDDGDTSLSAFFTFPQYKKGYSDGERSKKGVADIEVTVVENHANLKIRSRRRPKQLIKVISGLQLMRLSVLHLNVTTRHQIVLYTLSLKVEDDCMVNSVEEIATAVYEMLGRIEEEEEEAVHKN